LPTEASSVRPDPLAEFLPRLYLPLLILFIAVATWRPLTGAEDTYAHAAVGRWIWQHQSIPHHTLWLWSTPPIEWIAHSWLSQLTFFSWMALGGEHLVLLMTVILAAAPFVAFWKLWEKRGQTTALTPLYFMLAVWCACVRFQARPELFSSLFLGALLLFFIQLPQALNWRNAIALIVMFATWANFHGAVALGLLVLGISVVCELLQQKGARASWNLVLLALGCVAAVNLNPYGLSYWQALQPVGGAMFEMIDEWKSPLTAPALPFEALILVCSVTAVAFVSWIKNPQRRWAQVVWLALAMALFFMARRNLWPSILISVAVAAANTGQLRALIQPAKPSPTPAMGPIIAVIALLTGSFVMLSPVALSMGGGMPALRATSPVLPQGAAGVVLQQNLPQPVFNDYLRSGYLHWRFAGQPPIYIDLLNAYPDDLLAKYFDIVKRTPRGVAEWEKINVNTVVFGSYKKTDRLAPLARYLDNSAEWRVAYNELDGKVWVRKNVRQVQP
jgi:hypothetical protein